MTWAADLQTGGKWVAQLYNSLVRVGQAELQQKVAVVINTLKKLDHKIKFDYVSTSSVECPQQVNDVDCGMCVAGAALTIALGLDIGRAPTEYPWDVRAKWHAAFLHGWIAKEAVLLNESFLVR